MIILWFNLFFLLFSRLYFGQFLFLLNGFLRFDYIQDGNFFRWIRLYSLIFFSLDQIFFHFRCYLLIILFIWFLYLKNPCLFIHFIFTHLLSLHWISYSWIIIGRKDNIWGRDTIAWCTWGFRSKLREWWSNLWIEIGHILCEFIVFILAFNKELFKFD